MKPRSLLLALPLLIAGCHKAGEPFKPAAAATLAPGWTKARDAESGLSLAMPPGWRVGMPKGQGGGFAMGGGYSANPGIGDMMGGGAGTGGPGAPDGAGDAPDIGAIMAKMEKEMTPEQKQKLMDAARNWINMTPEQREAAAAVVRSVQEKKALAELRTKGILLQCVDDSNGTMGEDPTRFYLQEYKNCGGLEALKSDEKDALSNEGAGEAVALPVGKGWMYQNKGQNRIGDIERHVTYLACDGATGYALRFVSTNSPKVFDDFHREVAMSLRKGS